MANDLEPIKTLACKEAESTIYLPKPQTSGNLAKGQFGNRDFIYKPNDDGYESRAASLTEEDTVHEACNAWFMLGRIREVAGTVKIDFDAREAKPGSKGLRNHGTKFRISPDDICRIYAKKEWLCRIKYVIPKRIE